MLFCPKFRKRRLKLIRNISEIDASIYNIPHSSRFTYTMNNQNVEIIKLVRGFLLEAYTDRDSTGNYTITFSVIYIF